MVLDRPSAGELEEPVAKGRQWIELGEPVGHAIHDGSAQRAGFSFVGTQLRAVTEQGFVMAPLQRGERGTHVPFADGSHELPVG